MKTRSIVRALPLLALGTTAALFAAGCVRDSNTSGGTAGTQSTQSAGAKKGPNDRLKIAVIPKGMTHNFWQTVKAGAESGAKEANAEIIWQGPKEETDVQDQQDIVKRFATEGVDGIVLAATDKAALSKTVDEVQAKGVPVVIIDSGIEPDTSHSFIATDNVEAAKLAAREMGRLLGGKGKVAVISFKKGSGTSDQREEGFLLGIKEFPGITVVQPIQYSDSAASIAQDRMETVLNTNPDLAGVFASSEPNVVGVAKAVKGKGLAGKVKVIGFDASDPELDYLKEGVVQGTVVQDPFRMGSQGVKAIAMIARGLGTPEKRIDTGARLVTKETLAQPEIDRLLHPPIQK